MGQISRREFLKYSGATISSFMFAPLFPYLRDWSVEEIHNPKIIGRVTTSAINIYSEPDFKSDRIGKIKRDSLLWIHEQLSSHSGYLRNHRWYRLIDGYVHSAYIQRVEDSHDNPMLQSIPEGGQLGEITVPFVHTLRKDRHGELHPLYRLYYGSIHWITGIESGPNGEIWYELMNDRLRIKYSVPAECVRPIEPDELSPISPGVPADRKRIEINLNNQVLRAFEGDQLVFERLISSGIPSRGPSPNGIPTETPDGNFRIQVKIPSRHMGDGEITSDIEAYELLGVPWVSFFHHHGIGLHGTFWHDNFGNKMSHGCVNMRNEDAKWIYRWSQPIATPEDWNCKGAGTRIRII